MFEKASYRESQIWWVAVAALALSACAPRGGAMPDPDRSTLTASRRGAAIGGITRRAVVAPESVSRDPVAGQLFQEQLRRQIIHKTRTIPDVRFTRVVRPHLRAQLLSMGLPPEEADSVLSDVDYARGR